jgi:beta-glucosidase
LRSSFDELTFNENDRSGFAEAIELAKNADIVILAIGEDCWQSGEARSQSEIGLKGLQIELFDAIHAANSNIVVVLMNGRPLALGAIATRATAILETWFLGSQAGHSIADVLFGDYAPSGRLPVSFPRNNGQLPIYYNHHATGRPKNLDGNVYWSHYSDVENDPLYPFGYGLSYTSFAYTDLKLSSQKMNPTGEIEIRVLVSNKGPRAGVEVVQLYRHDIAASAVRPVKELIGFQRVSINPGESQHVRFTLRIENLKFHSPAGKWEAEAGLFRIFIGPNSRDLLDTIIELTD